MLPLFGRAALSDPPLSPLQRVAFSQRCASSREFGFWQNRHVPAARTSPATSLLRESVPSSKPSHSCGEPSFHSPHPPFCQTGTRRAGVAALCFSITDLATSFITTRRSSRFFTPAFALLPRNPAGIRNTLVPSSGTAISQFH